MDKGLQMNHYEDSEICLIEHTRNVLQTKETEGTTHHPQQSQCRIATLSTKPANYKQENKITAGRRRITERLETTKEHKECKDGH